MECEKCEDDSRGWYVYAIGRQSFSSSKHPGPAAGEAFLVTVWTFANGGYLLQPKNPLIWTLYLFLVEDICF